MNSCCTTLLTHVRFEIGFMGYQFDVLDNNVLTKVSIFMLIFREQASISLYEHIKSISIRTCVCKVVYQLFVKYIIQKLNTFSICKYAKTVNLCSSYALVDGALESRTPC